MGGLWSTLQDTWGEALLALGQPINDALRPLLDEAIRHVGSLQEGAKQVGTAVAGAMKAIVAFFREFSAAEMGKLALDSLVLGFKGAVNVLYRGLVGALAAAGQLIVENFKTGITLFSILTTADFWKGMGNALAGIAKTFGALLLDLIAKAVEGLKKIPGAGKLLGNADAALREGAQVGAGERRRQLRPRPGPDHARLRGGAAPARGNAGQCGRGVHRCLRRRRRSFRHLEEKWPLLAKPPPASRPGWPPTKPKRSRRRRPRRPAGEV